MKVDPRLGRSARRLHPASRPAMPEARTALDGTGADFWTTMHILVRRWPVVLAGCALTLIAGTGLVKVIPAKYKATATMILVIPSGPDAGVPAVPGATTPGPLNPYLELGGSLLASSEVLAKAMNGPDVAADLHIPPGSSFVVDVVAGDAPIISVAGTGTTAAGALAAERAAAEGARNELAALQRRAGAPTGAYIQLNPLIDPRRAGLQRGSKIRALAAVSALGLAGTLLGAFLVESMAERRRSRWAGPMAEPLEEPPIPDPRAERCPVCSAPLRPAGVRHNHGGDPSERR